MKKSLILLFCSTLIFLTAFNPLRDEYRWGATGHRITGEIAQMNLSSKALKKVMQVTGNHSLANLSTFPDDVKSDRAWRFMSGLHFINVNDDQTLEEVLSKTEDDMFPTNVVAGIKFFKDILSGNRAKKKLFTDAMSKNKAGLHGLASVEEVALAYLIHFIGDLHQPFHAGRAYDRGGNLIGVLYKGYPTNLHSVWDGNMIAEERMSYTQYAESLNIASSDSISLWQRHSPKDWAQESVDLKIPIYTATYRSVSGNPKIPNLDSEYVTQMTPIMNARLLKGGVRLAGILNEIFK